MRILNAILAIIERDLRNVLKKRIRWVSGLVRPLLWLVIVGTGFNTMIPKYGNINYQEFMVPGVIGMTALFTGILSSISMARDRESGMMRLLILAPISRSWLVIARLFSSAIMASIQVSLLIITLLIFSSFLQGVNVPYLLLGIILTALMCASLGMLIAVSTHTSENFSVIMNFLVFPIFFLSGALYPLDRLPELMRQMVSINPFTYCVELLQHSFHVGLAGLHYWQNLTAATVFITFFTFLACIKFKRSFETI